MIRVGIVAPGRAYRVGLKALLQEAGVQVVFDVSSPVELETVPLEVDVLAAAEEAAGQGLWQALQNWEEILGVHPAVLLLANRYLEETRRDGTLGPLPGLDRAGSRAQRELAGLPARAWGMLTADATADELGAAVRAVQAGLLVGDPELLIPLLGSPANPNEAAPAEAEPLTGRETEVLQHLSRGLANKQIAVRLGISEHTVKFHVSSIYSKLGAGNRTEAVRIGVQQGWISL